MIVATGIICLVLGSIIVIGQSISATSFSLAQKLGLQENDDATDPLFRSLEINTARWDLIVLWTLPLTGVLMIWGCSWWPAAALVTGAVSIDTAGREMAKVLGLKNAGVSTGSANERRLYFGLMGSMLLIGLLCLILGIWDLA